MNLYRLPNKSKNFILFPFFSEGTAKIRTFFHLSTKSGKIFYFFSLCLQVIKERFLLYFRVHFLLLFSKAAAKVRVFFLFPNFFSKKIIFFLILLVVM